MFISLVLQHSQKWNIISKFATICCHFLHVTESDSPVCNLVHNSARAVDADG